MTVHTVALLGAGAAAWEFVKQILIRVQAYFTKGVQDVKALETAVQQDVKTVETEIKL